MHMSRLGKSFKNRFLRRALAMVLAGMMVMSGMPVSVAAESSESKTSIETEVQGASVSEEVAEDEEVEQKESSEAQTQEKESAKPTEETETASKTETTTKETDKETEKSSEETSKESTNSSEIRESEESESESEETSETEGSEEENEATSFTSNDAALAEGHSYALWDVNGLVQNNKGTSSGIQSTEGIYKNSENDNDILFVDAIADNAKFAVSNEGDRIQINFNTKIYIPVKVDNNVAKIILYQSGVSKKENLMVANQDSNGNAKSYFAISEAEGNLQEAECTAFDLGETVSGRKYYKTEWTCTLKDSVSSALICVEVKDANNYVTKIISGKEVEKPRDDVYDDAAGDSADLVKYNMEGYANNYGVTGGGAMKIDAANYHKVGTAEEFLQALVDIKKASKPSVIRITKNLNLGCNEIKNISNYSQVISAHKNQPLCSPVLGTKDEPGTGVSTLSLDGFQNLTIFSTNGAAIKHCCIVLKDSKNIVFRNLVFDELWEWDDLVYYKADESGDPELKNGELQLTQGDYDRNDWDYIGVDMNSDGIWIDHCTFYKSYDGVIDIKNPKEDGEERVTVSWCRFEGKSAPDKNGNHPFYDKQLEWLKENIDSTNYYRALMSEEGTSVAVTATDGKIFTKTQNATIQGEGFSDSLIESYTLGQKKTHLLGQGDEATNAVGIRATFANNIYKNSMDRMPRLRFGNAHMYNTVLDASDIYYAHRLEGGDSEEAEAERKKLDGHLVSNGAISTMNGNVFIDTCYIDGIEGPILSGNGDSEPGYIGWDNCKYKKGNDTPELDIQYKNNADNKDYKLTKEAFTNKLPENYVYSLYTGELDNLREYLSNKTGAGVVSMTDLQWTKVSYGDGNTDNSNPTNWDPSADNDPSEDEGTEPPEPDNPPVVQNDKELRADTLDTQAALTADLKVNDYFTVTKGCEVAEGSATINDITFTKYIKLSTKGSKENSIQITASGKGTATVYVASNDGIAVKTVQLLDSTGKVVADFVSDVTQAEAVTLQIPEAGTYYVASADGELHVYGIDLKEDESSGEETPIIEFSLSADEIKWINLTQNSDGKDQRVLKEKYRRNGFTIQATEANTVVVDKSKKSVDGKQFTQRIKLGSAGSADSRSIRFKAETAGTLTVFEASASTKETRECRLYKVGTTQPILTEEAPTGDPVKKTFEITEPGEYYVAGNGAINICYIAFSNQTGGITPPDPGEYAPEEVDAEWTTLPALIAESVYDAEDAKDASKVMYNLEGYAGAANVTGGGLIREDTAGYYKVTDEKEFLEALSEVRNVTDRPNVIEITTDLNLGKLELKEKFGLNILAKGEKTEDGKYGDFSAVIKAYTIQPRMHPTLKKTGVSYLNMHAFQNLTIFSKNGATIKHAGLKFEDVSTKNVIIRNLAFDELWEWDEGGFDAKGEYKVPGDYDINDWDYITIDEHAEGIWIDHCTFYKSYDGLIDIKNNSNDNNYYQRVTISWCEFLPGSKDNVFFNEQMKWLEDNINNEEVEIAYYRQLRKEKMKAPNADKTMSAKDVWWYVYGQKKAHLLGSADSATADKVMRVTFANNYHKNAMSRLPRLRFGKVHEYNCVFDAQQMDVQYQIGNPHITGNGAISACNGEMLLENCYIRGLRSPLRSGYSSSKDDRGYINAVDSVYYYIDKNTKQMQLTTPEISESSAGKKITDEVKFKEKLPEGYVFTTRDATQLYKTVVPYAGAGKLDMTTVQWEATNYGTNNVGSETPSSPSQIEPAIPSEYDEMPTTPWDDPENPDNPPTEPTTIDAPTASPAEEAQFPSTGGEITLDCTTDGATIYYTISDTEAGLTDPADATNTNRVQYDKGTKIPITKETYIWAVAVKDDKASDPLKCHYTVLAEGAVARPIATPGSSKPVASGTKVTLSAMGEFDSIYYTKGATPDTTADPTKEDSGREPFNSETGIIITEAVTIKAVAKKGDTYSDVATFTYTIKTDTPDDGKKVKAPVEDPAAGAVKKGTPVRLKSETQGAAIYYTTDKTDPAAESKYLYNDETPIIIEEPVTIKAFAVKDGLDNSDVVSFEYTITDESPVDPEKPEIKTININECTITVPSAIYNKKAGNKQSVTYVTYNYTDAAGNEKNVKFAEDVDYEAAWEKAGNEYKVTLQGKGRSASGRDVDGFIIDKDSKTEPITYKVYTSAKDAGLVNISKAKVDFKANVKANLKTAHYTGYAHEVRYEDLDFSKDKIGLKNVPKDYIRIACRNNINAGKATVSISVDPKFENGKYAGSKTLTFTIKKAALNKNSAKATALAEFDKNASEKQQYMGSAIEAKNLKVKPKNGREGSLRKNEDYTVTYKNSVKSGTVTVNVTVKGVGNNLSGSWSGSFTIKQLDLSDKMLTFDTNEGKLPYSPKGAKLGTITVTKDGKACTLRAGVDYTAKYVYTDKAKKYDVGGKVTATITGKGLCKGTTTFKDLEIIKADFDEHIIVSDDVTADSDAFKADKSKALSKAVTVTDAAGVKLSLNKDYKIIDIKGVSDTEEKTFTIQPIGKNAKNYTGTKIISYRVAKNLAKDKNFIFNKDLEKKDPLAYDGRNPVKLTTAQIDKYINKNISTDNPNYDTRTYRLGGKNANIEIVPGTYKNNAKKGTAQVTVRGIAGVDGGFYGQKVLKFKIVEK